MIDGYEDRLTVNRPVSEVMAVNQAAGRTPKLVSPTTYELIKLAVHYSRENFGFNALIGPLVKLWKIGFAGANVPSDQAIKERLQLIDPYQVLLDDDNRTVYLEQPGMELDLGGIAKGYIADRVRDFWLAQGVPAGIINLGGNLVFIGQSPRRADGQWIIGVQDPQLKRGHELGNGSPAGVLGGDLGDLRALPGEGRAALPPSLDPGLATRWRPTLAA